MIGEAGFEDDVSLSNRYAALRSNSISVGRTEAVLTAVAVDKSPLVDCEGAVERLWEFCEGSQGEMKLVLPDSVHTPYYLPQPKKAPMNPEQEDQRERKRLETQTRKLAVSRTHKSDRHAIKNCTHKTLTLRELAIESRIMDKYRMNPDLAKGILKKVRSNALGRKVEQLSLYKLHDKSEMLSLSPDRHLRASARRDELVASEEQHHREMEETWMEKVKKQEHDHLEALPTGARRQAMWIVKIAALARLHKLYLVVVDVQERRRQDYKRWDAASKIQRVYRAHYHGRLRGEKPDHSLVRPRESPLEKLKRSMVQGGQAVTFQTRQQACIVLLSLLRLTSKSCKSILLGYVRKVKLVQRVYRRHVQVNTHRVDLLSLFLDRLFPVFFAHCQLVLAGKGEDLHNLLSLDVHRLHEVMRPFRRFAVTDGLLSFAVHAQLRTAQGEVRQVSRYFGPAARLPLRDVADIKRRVLLASLFKKRQAFVSRGCGRKPACMATKTFTAQEVRGFIQGGHDPLQQHLREEQAQQEAWHRDYWAGRRRGRAGETASRPRGTPREVLPLLSTLTAEELCALYLQITSLASQAQALAPATKPGGGAAGQAGMTGGGRLEPPRSLSSASSDTGGRRPSLPSKSSVGEEDEVSKGASPRRRSLVVPQPPPLLVSAKASPGESLAGGTATSRRASFSKAAGAGLSPSLPSGGLGQTGKGPLRRAIVEATSDTQSVVGASPHRAQPPAEQMPSRRAAPS